MYSLCTVYLFSMFVQYTYVRTCTRLFMYCVLFTMFVQCMCICTLYNVYMSVNVLFVYLLCLYNLLFMYYVCIYNIFTFWIKWACLVMFTLENFRISCWLNYLKSQFMSKHPIPEFSCFPVRKCTVNVFIWTVKP